MHQRKMMLAATLLLSMPVAAQIYRCEIDGVVTFSDRPCGVDSSVYAGASGVSFVVPDENLPAMAEAARAFIDQRRTELARTRNPVRPSPEARAVERGQMGHKLFLLWPSPAHGYLYPSKRGRPEPSRAAPLVADNDRYSPLNGPILGTRRGSAAFDRPSERAVGRRDRAQ